MGKPGPRPKHPDLKRLDGNPGKTRIQPVVRASGDAGAPPDFLSDDAADCWRVVKGSMPVGFYSAADIPMLTAFCEAWSTFVVASKKLKQEGAVVITSTGQPYQNPWQGIINTQSKLMVSLGDKLGLSPAARIGLKVEKDERPSKFGTLLEPNGSSASFGNSRSRAA